MATEVTAATLESAVHGAFYTLRLDLTITYHASTLENDGVDS